MKKIIFVLCFLISSMSFCQDIPLGSNFLLADLVIDSISLEEGTTKIDASGKIGNGYGQVYLTYVFTNKMKTVDSGEFTGLAWSQLGENSAKASLQGIWKRKGVIYEIYTFDNISDGKKTVAKGIMDIVNRTLKFEVSQFE
jgi:hypothetical protein